MNRLNDKYFSLTAIEMQSVVAEKRKITHEQKINNATQRIHEMYRFYNDCKKHKDHERYTEFQFINKQLILYEHIIFEIIDNDRCELVAYNDVIRINIKDSNHCLINKSVIESIFQLITDLGYIVNAHTHANNMHYLINK
jgi:hypothetical protein